MDPGDDDAVAAWHEAAHGVVARLLGGDVRWLTLEADEEAFGGRSEIAWPPATAREHASLSARVALAGPIAELERYGDDDLGDPRVLSAWEADWAEVERCAGLVAADEDDRRSAIRAWAAEVRHLLRGPGLEELVARVADTLEAHRTLDQVLFEDCFA